MSREGDQYCERHLLVKCRGHLLRKRSKGVGQIGRKGLVVDGRPDAAGHPEGSPVQCHVVGSGLVVNRVPCGTVTVGRSSTLGADLGKSSLDGVIASGGPGLSLGDPLPSRGCSVEV